MRYLITAMLYCGIVFITSCKKQDNSDQCYYTQATINNIAAPGAEVNALTQFIKKDSIQDVILDPRGFYYKIEREGSVEKPLPCAQVTINYTGKLTDGKTFDTGESIPFNLGDLILGWKAGLPLVGTGGRITLYLPPSFAYGDKAINGIPANSILIFSVDLINFTNP